MNIYGYAASSLLCETWHHADSQVPLKTSKLRERKLRESQDVKFKVLAMNHLTRMRWTETSFAELEKM